MTKLQASKLSKSANFVRIFCQSNGDQKVSKHAWVDYTVLHAIVHADWPIQMLSVAIVSSRAWHGPLVLRSTNPLLPNFALLGDQNPNLSLTSFKRRRTWQQEQAKKSTGQSFHRACSCRFCWTGPAAMIVVALRAEDCFKKKKKSTEQWRKEHSICTLLMIEQTLISFAFTRGQPKLTKLWTKTCNRCPHRQRVTFQAGHAESTIPLNSENWVHELLIPQVQYYPSAPTNMKKHLRVTSDEEKLVSLLCEWVLIDHGFRDRTLHPGAPARKEVFETALVGPARTQPDVFLVFSRTGNPLVGTVFLARSTKVDEKFKYRLYTARNNCYNHRRTTKLRRARSSITPRKQPHRSRLRAMKKRSKIRSFLWCTFLALFLSRLKCAFCQRSLRQRRDALKSLPQRFASRKLCSLELIVKALSFIKKPGHQVLINSTTKLLGLSNLQGRSPNFRPFFFLL